MQIRTFRIKVFQDKPTRQINEYFKAARCSCGKLLRCLVISVKCVFIN